MSDVNGFNLVSKDVTLSSYSGNENVVRIPENVTEIGSYAFATEKNPNTTIKKIIIPSSVTTIKKFAFAFCKNLTEIEWGTNQKLYIEREIFCGCDSLTEITIPERIPGIADFPKHKGLKINVHDGLYFVSAYAFDMENKDRTYSSLTFRMNETINILLQNPAYKIIDGFMVNTKLKVTLFLVDLSKKEVRIPDGIEEIQLFTFDEFRFTCEDSEKTDYFGNIAVPVEKVIIPASVKIIRRSAFMYCHSLKEIVYEGKKENLEIEENAFNECGAFSVYGGLISYSDKPRSKRMGSFAALERIRCIHGMIKTGSYPSFVEILTACRKLHLGKEDISESTVRRTIDSLRFSFNAPLKYDKAHDGYYYEEDFELDINKITFV